MINHKQQSNKPTIPNGHARERGTAGYYSICASNLINWTTDYCTENGNGKTYTITSGNTCNNIAINEFNLRDPITDITYSRIVRNETPYDTCTTDGFRDLQPGDKFAICPKDPEFTDETLLNTKNLWKMGVSKHNTCHNILENKDAELIFQKDETDKDDLICGILQGNNSFNDFVKNRNGEQREIICGEDIRGIEEGNNDQTHCYCFKKSDVDTTHNVINTSLNNVKREYTIYNIAAQIG